MIKKLIHRRITLIWLNTNFIATTHYLATSDMVKIDCDILLSMSVEAVDFGSVALRAAARDLVAPLSRLRQLSFQIESDTQSNLSPETAQALREMRLTVGQTFDIAEQLDIATKQAQNLQLEPVQLTGLCYEIQQELAPLENVLQCELNFELPRRNAVVVVGNYQALKTILKGFLVDAFQYSKPNDDGKRVIRARVSAGKRGHAKLLVKDDGPNVNLRHSLQQAMNGKNLNPTSSRPLSGSLNLLLANELIDAMNGKLLVHNHRQGGVTVETRLLVSNQLSFLPEVSQ